MLSSRIRIVLAAWCLAEALVFALAVHLFGLGWTLLAEFAVGVLGLVLLKRTGSAAMVRLRAAFRGRMAGPRTGLVEEALGVLGALLLLLPGFLSDVLGLVLVVRPLRVPIAAFVASRIGAGGARFFRRRPAGPGVVDLQPDEWRRGDGRRRPELRP